MEYMTFKEGDTIRMKEDCSGNKEGEIYKVHTKTKSGSYTGDLFAWSEKTDGVGCYCKYLWELVTEPKTLETLEVGDRIMNPEGQIREILAVLQRRGEKTLYAVSPFGSYVEASMALFTAHELKLDDFTIVSQPTEVTMTPSEIEEKLGMEKGTLKIKE